MQLRKPRHGHRHGRAGLACAAFAMVLSLTSRAFAAEAVRIDARAAGRPFPHFREET